MEGDGCSSDAVQKEMSNCGAELDQGFLTDCSLPALQTEATLKPPKSIVVEYTDSISTLLSSSNNFSGGLSPSNPSIKMSLLSPTLTIPPAGMRGLLEGNSSTPYQRMTIQKPVLPNTLDPSFIDLTTSDPLWEVSLIKPNVESPKLCLDSSKVEFIWSPSYQGTPSTLAEISSLLWSGTPPEGRRSFRELAFQGSNLRHAVLELTDEQQKSLSRNMAM